MPPVAESSLEVRADFPIFSRRFDGRPLIYLDSAATSQKPEAVISALADHLRNHNANVHRSPHLLGEEATQMYEDARARSARFVGAPDASTIVFNRGSTESLNLVAHGWARKFLREGDEILISELEHHSNIVPWQLATRDTGAVLRYIPITDDGQLDLSELPSLLTEKTKLVAISGMSNVLGTVPPIRTIADAAHASGALLCVDGAQLVAHAPVDVAELDCDFLAFSGHKMLGPTASGGLYARRELLEAMDPFMGGGEMISEVRPEMSTWNEVPWKFEGGTMNIAQEIGLAAACDYLDELGMDNVRAHEEDVTGYAIERLLEAGVRLFGPADVRDAAVRYVREHLDLVAAERIVPRARQLGVRHGPFVPRVLVVVEDDFLVEVFERHSRSLRRGDLHERNRAAAVCSASTRASTSSRSL